MPSLAVGGINIPVKANTVREIWRDIGGITRAYNGTARLSRQAQKRDLEFETTPMSVSDAYAWTNLLTGQGTSITFESNVYSSKGHPTATNVGGWSSVVSGLFPSLTGNAGTGDGYGAVTWTIDTPSDAWSILMWRATLYGDTDSDRGALGEHFIIRSDGKVYRAGVQKSSTGVVGVYPNVTWLTFTGNTFTLNCEGSVIGLAVRANSTAYSLGTRRIGNTGATQAGSGEIYMYKVTTAGTTGGSPPTWNTTIGGTTTDGTVTWTNHGVARGRVYDLFLTRGLAPAQWGIDAAANPYVHGALPALLVQGDLIAEGSRSVLGEVEQRTIRGHSSGSPTNLVSLSVKLTEV